MRYIKEQNDLNKQVQLFDDLNDYLQEVLDKFYIPEFNYNVSHQQPRDFKFCWWNYNYEQLIIANIPNSEIHNSLIQHLNILLPTVEKRLKREINIKQGKNGEGEDYADNNRSTWISISIQN